MNDDNLRACFLVHAWKTFGTFDVKNLVVTAASPDLNGFSARCLVCKADACEVHTLFIHCPLSIASDKVHLWRRVEYVAVPDARLAVLLLLQPLALAAMGGMALLAVCLFVQTDATDALLRLIGGRETPWPTVVFVAAHAAHFVEAAIAWRLATRLPGCINRGLAWRWCGLVFLVGFPVLRRVLELGRTKKSAQ
mmetsp:Transcript_30099/g.49837  ORF Transcript_30099/g.49837 Transcript_30099/m.49837 type:complete len:194 (+) Transcript_30099:163-744(+)